MASICEITSDVSEESGLFWEDEIKETGKKIKALLVSLTILSNKKLLLSNIFKYSLLSL